MSTIQITRREAKNFVKFGLQKPNSVVKTTDWIKISDFYSQSFQNLPKTLKFEKHDPQIEWMADFSGRGVGDL